MTEKKTDLVDSRSLQNARVEPFPNNASEYRQWKNTRSSFCLDALTLLVKSEEALAQWVAPAFHVGSVKASECLESSGSFPRLCW